MLSPVCDVRPARDVAGGEDARHARFQVLVDEYPAVDPKAGRSASAVRGLTPTPATTRSALRLSPPLRIDAIPIDAGRRLSQMEFDPMLLMKRLDETSEVRPEDLLHRDGIGSDHVYLDAAGPERGGDFQADEARAQDDGRLGALRALDDGAAVGERPQREHVRLVRAGYREPHGLGPGRDAGGGRKRRTARLAAMTVRPSTSMRETAVRRCRSMRLSA